MLRPAPRLRSLLVVLSSLSVLVATAPPAAAETSELLDGRGGGAGRVDARIATDTAAIVVDGVPWLFYGANDGAGWDLRLARLDDTPAFRTLDGAGGTAGRTTHSVGADVSAVVFEGVPHVFYRDQTDDTLRHAWKEDGLWRFEVVDGNSTAGDRTEHEVGRSSTAAVFAGELHVAYLDDVADAIRLASFDGTSWSRRRIVGSPVRDHIVAGVWDGALHVLFSRHAEGTYEARLGRNGALVVDGLLDCCVDPRAILVVSRRDDVYVTGGRGWGHWTGGDSWHEGDLPGYPYATGQALFVDGGVVHLASRWNVCYGSGGCDDELIVYPWNGGGFGGTGPFADPFEGSVYTCCRDGVASSSVTVGGTGSLFIGGVEHAVDTWVEVDTLVMVEGPFE